MTAVEVLHVFQSLYSLPSTYADRCIKRGKESSHHWYFAPMRKIGGDRLLSQIFVGDKNWVRHFDPILKLQFTKWQPNDILTESVTQLVKFPAFSGNIWSQLPATCPSPEADEPIPLLIPPVYAEDFVVVSCAQAPRLELYIRF